MVELSNCFGLHDREATHVPGSRRESRGKRAEGAGVSLTEEFLPEKRREKGGGKRRGNEFPQSF